MAGSCRPEQCKNSIEARFKPIAANAYRVNTANCTSENGASGATYNANLEYKNIKLNALFNGSLNADWDYPDRHFTRDSNNGNLYHYTRPDLCGMYWNNGNCYFEIESFDRFTLWTYGHAYDGAHHAEFNKVLKYVNGQYVDVTSTLEINDPNTKGVQLKWVSQYKNIPAGRYRFMVGSGTYRMDAEWFLEKVDPALINNKALLKANNDKLLPKIDEILESKLPEGSYEELEKDVMDYCWNEETQDVKESAE